VLKQIQQQFIGQIIGKPDCNIISSITDHGDLTKQQRLHIYTSAYRIRLKQCIESDYPILGLYLGDELFDLMVDNYIDQHPSHSTSLRYFADELSTMLNKTAPFKDHAVIAELASFERVLLSAFDAAESDISTTEDIALIPIESWPTMCFQLHPSVRIFSTQFNTVEIWQSIKQDHPVPETNNLGNKDWLIWRNPVRLTEFKSLTTFESEIIKYMLNNKSFSDICEMLAEFYKEDQIEQEILTHLISLLHTNIIKFVY
jgi:hypothetical protein